MYLNAQVTCTFFFFVRQMYTAHPSLFQTLSEPDTILFCLVVMLSLQIDHFIGIRFKFEVKMCDKKWYINQTNLAISMPVHHLKCDLIDGLFFLFFIFLPSSQSITKLMCALNETNKPTDM